ncbi:hypothetical protein CRE_25288 [Caenorhabditis remanei]|uniref:Uncharacterized protein n=1 Tax=Caenorhabditis remanei TaxID=31234 RepID=E3LSC3_CAERE|nr:hypothetical protein CRE_25288 [Caenorhabditis remanei]
MFEKGNVALADVLHIVFTAAVVGFYIMMSALNPSSIFHHIFAGFAIFETFVSFLYIYQVKWLMRLHFMFQSILFVIPIFVFSVNLENLFGSAPVLDAFRLDQVKNFVSSSGSTTLSSVALLVWLFRMLNTFIYIIEAEKINPTLTIKYLFSKHVLNVTSIILFVVLYLSVENPIKDACFWLSFIEIALELLYFGSTLDAKGFSITITAWVYQAALFSVPCFLSVLYFVHDFLWGLRLGDTLTTLIAEHASPISENRQTTTRSTSK